VTRTVDDILAAAAATLTTAEYGLRDLNSSDHERRLAGLRNLVVFGRAVTNVVQNLRSVAPDFDNWYQPFVVEMRDDPLLRFFYELRSIILKEGALPVGKVLHVKNLNIPDDLGPPPPGATSIFISDPLGGIGWLVELADGTTEKYYVALPADIASVDLFLAGCPQTHRGHVIQDRYAHTVCQLYFDYLRDFLSTAKAHFGSSALTASA
jgi:hypothetical protein